MFMPVAAPPVEQRVFQRENGEILTELQDFYQQNGDLVGWLKIGGVVNAPVVFRDNVYYLTHGFDRKENVGGAIFLDAYHPMRGTTQNFLLFGHNMRDGTVFGHLAKYRDPAYLTEHCLVTFSTLYEKFDYFIFTVIVTSADPSSDHFVNYAGYPTFASDDVFHRYMDRLRQHSLFAWGADVKSDDALLTLSTCLEGDERITLLARRLREGEDGKAMQSNYFRIR